jgi:hypothetical protein
MARNPLPVPRGPMDIFPEMVTFLMNNVLVKITAELL